VGYSSENIPAVVGAHLDVALPSDAGSPDGAPLLIPGVDVSLDHPFDQTVSVATNLDASTPGLDFQLRLYRGGVPEIFSFQQTASGASGTLYTVAPTPPFDSAFKRVLFVSPSNGNATSTTLLTADAGAVSVTFPAPPAVTAPATAAQATDAGPVVPLTSGLRVAWTLGDPTAQAVNIDLSCALLRTDGGSVPYDWNIVVPASAGSFALFAPPADTGTQLLCPAARIDVLLTSLHYEGASFQDILQTQYGSGDLVSLVPTSAVSTVGAWFRTP
jgi:hypothetical protein